MSYNPDVPEPADAMPPAVDQAGRQGTARRRFALADHTHASSVQAQRVQIALTNGLGIWIFPTAYETDVVPVIEATAETPAGADYRLDASIVQGSATNTQCQIRVTRMSQTIAGGLNALFAPATGSVWLHMWARKATTPAPPAAPIKTV